MFIPEDASTIIARNTKVQLAESVYPAQQPPARLAVSLIIGLPEYF
jgi:hypothetical protein